jgi:hypothetical protein
MIVKLGGDKTMKRNIFLAIAVTALMVGSTIAEAADVSFSGQIRPRFNLDQDTTDGTKTSKTFSSRVRLNAKANVNANTEVFLQFQSVGTWGTNDAFGEAGTRVSAGGGAGFQGQASDNLADVGFHQAYVTLKNFAGQAVDAKIGRQEVILDGHRLFGNTGWTDGAETKDAIRLTHAGGNHAINYIFIESSNEDSGVGSLKNDRANVHVLHTNTQGVLGGALSGYFTITNDAATDTTGSNEENWYTLGARQAGKMLGIDYRVEYYHQLGEAGNLATASGYGITNGRDADRDANMVGVRLGKKIGSGAVTLWYDRLSGVDDDDQSSGDWGAFDTMYDTGHKFYGFQDFYLARNGAGTRFFGLQDIAIKTKMSPRAGWTLKADVHHFRTATDLSGGDADGIITSLADAATVINGAMDSDLGTEVDLTVVHKYDANTKIVAGYSHYFTTNTFGQLNCGAAGTGGACGSNSNDDSDWAYVMVDTKF